MEFDWKKLIANAGSKALLHPLRRAKILIQVGYEPRMQCKSFSPEIVSYVQHIKDTEGITGLLKGYPAQSASDMVYEAVYTKVGDKMKYLLSLDVKEGSHKKTVTETLVTYAKHMVKEAAAMTAAIVASHPFRVIAIRCMAHGNNEEELYRNSFLAMLHVYQEHGMWGYFAGIVPRIVCEVSAMLLAKTVGPGLNYFIVDKDMKQYVSSAIGILAMSVFFPVDTVASSMAVAGSCIAPAKMEVYYSWIHCYNVQMARQGIHFGMPLFRKRTEKV